mgnify:CR=1 FL=1
MNDWDKFYGSEGVNIAFKVYCLISRIGFTVRKGLILLSMSIVSFSSIGFTV